MSKGYMNYVAGITIFVVFFSMIIISGGIQQIFGQERLEEYDITKDDLQIRPDLPEAFEERVDLEDDLIYSENVSVVLTENLTTPGYTEVSDTALVLDNGTVEGFGMYRINGETDVVDTSVPYWGFLQSSHVTLEFYETTDTNNTSPTSTHVLDGQQSWTVGDDDNYMVFKFTDNPNGATPAVYDIRQQTGEEAGFLATLGAYATSSANTINAWFTLLTGLPSSLFWVGVVLTLIGGVIVLEVVLW